MPERLFFAVLALGLLLAAGGCASPGGKQSGGAADKESLARALERPRPHHYLFAHRVMPQFFFKNTDSFFMRLQAEPATEAARVWDYVGEPLRPEDRLPAEGLTAEYRTGENGLRMVVVTLPPAKISPEAIYLVLAIRGRDRFCLTYERSHPLMELKDIAILCGWDSSGGHLNFGFGGDHSREAFEKALTKFFSEDMKPASTTIMPAAKSTAASGK
jgi:hypothetical protein